MKDLFDWQKDIKKKDKSIRKQGGGDAAPAPPTLRSSTGQAITGSVDSSLPAPRGRAVTSQVSVAPESLQAPGILPAAMRQRRPLGTSSGTAPHGPAGDAPGGAPQRPKRMKKKVKGPALPEGAARLGRTAASHTYAAYQKWDKFDVDAALQSDDEPSEYETDSEAETAVTASSSAKTALSPPSSSPPPSVRAAAPAAPNAPISVAPREPLTSSDLKERSTTRTLPAPTSASPPALSSAVSSEPLASSSARDHPPIRSHEPQTSEAWRARGNDLFKIGQWSSALECYSRSLDYGPNCLAYANRAMARLKLEQWTEAEQDCSQALLLDPAYTKAHHRRGTARRKLGLVLEATEDYESALRLDPTSAAARSERDACVKALMAAESLKEPTKRTKLTINVKAPAGQLETKGDATAASPASERGAVASGNRAVDVVRQSEKGMPDLGTVSPSPTADGSSRSNEPTTPPPKLPTAKVATAAAASLSKALPVQAPKTSTEFESAWRSLRGSPDQEASYLRLLIPEQLPSIFKSSLTPQVLTALLRAALTAASSASAASAALEDGSSSGVPASIPPPDLASSSKGGDPHWGRLLLHLSQVPRFGMTVMCLSSKDKEVLRVLWDQAVGVLALGLRGAGVDTVALRKSYRL